MTADGRGNGASPSGRRRRAIVTALGISQTLAFASSYYLIAILADPIARDLGVATSHVFAAFSVSLLIMAVVAPRVGRTIDLSGGREVLAVSNLFFAIGLALLALAKSPLWLWLAWIVLGIAMGLGLYDAAMATLGRLFGGTARSAITGITLIAGFASTIGWPLTTWGEAQFGWRATCAGWAVAHLALGLPLHLPVIPRQWPKLRVQACTGPRAAAAKPAIAIDGIMVLISFAFAASSVVATAMAAHLPRILESAGSSKTAAVAAAALIGPAQVAARFAEAGLLSRYHPILSARLSMLAHPIGAMLLLIGGGLAAMPFAILHGAGSGVQTIARGTIPLAIFGPENYGYRLGVIGAPGRLAQAGAPLAFGALIEAYGSGALYVSTGLCLAALLALLAVSADAGGKPQAVSPKA